MATILLYRLFSIQLENCLALGGTLTFDPSAVGDGNAIADCLVQLAPDFFTAAWRGKIISETAGNWKLKVCMCVCGGGGGGSGCIVLNRIS